MRRPENIRRLAVLLTGVLVLASCDRSTEASTTTAAPPPSLCVELGGDWDAPTETCRLAAAVGDGITVNIAATYPVALLEDHTAGPVLSGYLREFFERYRQAPASTGSFGHEGSATTTYSIVEHAPSTKSVVFQENWFVPGMAHPNDAVRTFTFDFTRAKQLGLSDLFCDGVNPLEAVPPLARPYVQQAFDERGYGPPLTVEQFEPGGLGSLAGGYEAWALDGDSLVLYMPTGRGPAGMPAGALRPRIPLRALKSILADGGCAV